MSSLTITPVTTAPANTTIAALFAYLEENNICGCFHEGKCRIIESEKICECLSGWEGSRCEETVIEFGFSHSENEQANRGGIGSEFIIAVAFACLIFVFLLICCYLVWRKCNRARVNREWVERQESRIQTKATIEGRSIVEPTPKQAYDIQLMKNCNQIFTFDRLNEKHSENGHADQKSEWVATICAERNNPLPSVHNCTSPESQLSIVLNRDRISFLTYSPAFVNTGYTPSSPSETQKKSDSFSTETETKKNHT